jgi:cation-transporting ATPase E
MLRATGHFVFPAAFTVAVVALVIYLAYLTLTGDVEIARTVLTSVTVLCGVLLIPFVEPPTPAWVGGDELSGDWRPSILALGMLGLFALTMAVAPLRHFFELVPLRLVDYIVLCSIAVAWALVLRLIWRARFFERLLDPG